jgi:uncharacterized protein (TIGR03437 family)
MVVQGDQLSSDAPVYAKGPPLPATLGGATVLVNGAPAPLYYSSPNQIAFQLPAGTPLGNTVVQVQRGGQMSNAISLQTYQRAPQILAITDANYNPRDFYHPAHAGDTIIVWVIGLGATNPPVPDGIAAPFDPPAVLIGGLEVSFGNASSSYTPSFVGLSPGGVGVYQVNVAIPPHTSAGNVFVKLLSGLSSNAMPLAIR